MPSGRPICFTTEKLINAVTTPQWCMQPSNNTGIDLEEKLAAIDRQLQDIRHDVADILYHVQDELAAIREHPAQKRAQSENIQPRNPLTLTHLKALTGTPRQQTGSLPIVVARVRSLIWRRTAGRNQAGEIAEATLVALVRPREPSKRSIAFMPAMECSGLMSA